MSSSLERFPPHDRRTCGAALSLYSSGGIWVKSNIGPHAALVRYSFRSILDAFGPLTVRINSLC